MNRLTAAHFVLLIAFAVAARFAHAHEMRPAHLDIAEVSAGNYLVRWKVPAMGDRRVAIDPHFSTGCADTMERGDNFAVGASLRSWRIECPDGLAGTEIFFSNLSATMIDVLVQVKFLDGRHYTALVRPSDPVFRVPERASEQAVFRDYFVLGVEHIFLGMDHLLFVVGMTILVRGGRKLFWTITGFTAAHSVTLALAMLDVIRVPAPPVDALVALSIVLLAVEVVQYERIGAETLAIRAPWLVSMIIGLVHGLGFAGSLADYGLPPYARTFSLAAFNLGVEAGQLAIVAALLHVAYTARKIEMPNRAVFPRLASWVIGTLGAFWLIERVTAFFA